MGALPRSGAYVGLMSGTSLDGVDVVIVTFEPQFKLIAARHTPYPPSLRQPLQQLITDPTTSLHQLGLLDAELGEFYATAVTVLLTEAGLDPAQITAIGSHGQTVAHAPHARFPFTLQIGDPNRIAHRCQITTIADFRRRDIAAGGEGAPLVPAFHRDLWQVATEERVVINLGGIANISILPPLEEGRAPQPVIGFDTGPANTLLDLWIQRHQGVAFDANGSWGRSGQLLEPLLHRLLSDPYFHRPPPKSSGREAFHLRWLTHHLSGTEQPVDVQRTLHELTARSVTDAIDRYAATSRHLILCGGGSFNGLLRERIEQLSRRAVATSAEYGLEPQWVEAAAFAWLAAQSLAGQSGNLPSVTGAATPVVLGGIYRSRPMEPKRLG